jgi:hypothetical protein
MIPTIDNGLVGIVTGSKSESFRRLNANLLQPAAAWPKQKLDRVVTGNEPTTKRIRQNSAGLNKTEQAFHDHLVAQGNGGVLSQAITLRLGNGVRYTPDFITVRERALPIDNRPAFQFDGYEVKGFMRDDAAVKLKVAASLYPWIKFHLVNKGKRGTWQIVPVLP